MILRKCDMCGETVVIKDGYEDEPGEALISIKEDGEGWDYQRYHLCENCTNKLMQWIAAGRAKSG